MLPNFEGGMETVSFSNGVYPRKVSFEYSLELPTRQNFFGVPLHLRPLTRRVPPEVRSGSLLQDSFIPPVRPGLLGSRI